MESLSGEFQGSVSLVNILSFRLAWGSNNFISWLFDDSFGSSVIALFLDSLGWFSAGFYLLFIIFELMILGLQVVNLQRMVYSC